MGLIMVVSSSSLLDEADMSLLLEIKADWHDEIASSKETVVFLPNIVLGVENWRSSFVDKTCPGSADTLASMCNGLFSRLNGLRAMVGALSDGILVQLEHLICIDLISV